MDIVTEVIDRRALNDAALLGASLHPASPLVTGNDEVTPPVPSPNH